MLEKRSNQSPTRSSLIRIADSSVSGGQIAVLRGVALSSAGRAFTILGVLASTVALALAFAQDQEVLQLQSAAVGEDPRAPVYLALLVGLTSPSETPTTS